MAAAKISLAVCVFSLGVVVSCQRVRTPAAPIADNTFLDLLPGWRLRTVTPVLNNPDQPFAPAAIEGPLGFEVKAMSNLKGFETQYHELLGSGTRVRLAFSKATMTVNGETHTEERPLKTYFPLPSGRLHLRLIYLARSTSAPHNMALVFARKTMAMASFSKEVSQSPQVCDSRPGWCLWIPANVAVIAERRSGDSRSDNWMPVQ